MSLCKSQLETKLLQRHKADQVAQFSKPLLGELNGIQVEIG